MASTVTKDEMRRLLEALPEEFTWTDVQRVYEEGILARGFADVRAGQVTSNEELRREFGLDP